MPASIRRAFAGAIALVAWLGLAVQLRATMGLTGSFAEALWVMLRYFTIITNLLVAIVMTAVALRRSRSAEPFPIGFVTLSILLVGVVYMTLLRGVVELSGGALLADTLLHKVTPLLTALFWLACAPKGTLRWRDPVAWSVFPLAYFVYALLRGSAEGKYAYPFIDLAALGPVQVGINAIGIAAAFLIAGALFVWLDRALARGPGAGYEASQSSDRQD